eukprot:11197058-Lingulodinium_polyedra.AAC.1
MSRFSTETTATTQAHETPPTTTHAPVAPHGPNPQQKQKQLVVVFVVQAFVCQYQDVASIPPAPRHRPVST